MVAEVQIVDVVTNMPWLPPPFISSDHFSGGGSLAPDSHARGKWHTSVGGLYFGLIVLHLAHRRLIRIDEF
jgi:hypothetical protein